MSHVCLVHTSFAARSHEPVWVVDTNTSRVELRKTEPAKAEQVDDDDVESEEARDTYGSIGGGMGGGAQPKLSDGSDDDPNEFILKMKKDLELQRQMLRLLAMAHKKAKVEWGASLSSRYIGQGRVRYFAIF